MISPEEQAGQNELPSMTLGQVVRAMAPGAIRGFGDSATAGMILYPQAYTRASLAKLQGDPRPFNDIYNEAIKITREERNELRKTGAYTLGSIAGLAVPGAGAAKVMKAPKDIKYAADLKNATMGANVVKGAGVGAAYGAGMGFSENDIIEGNTLRDTLLGAGLGGVLGVAGPLFTGMIAKNQRDVAYQYAKDLRNLVEKKPEGWEDKVEELLTKWELRGKGDNPETVIKAVADEIENQPGLLFSKPGLEIPRTMHTPIRDRITEKITSPTTGLASIMAGAGTTPFIFENPDPSHYLLMGALGPFAPAAGLAALRGAQGAAMSGGMALTRKGVYGKHTPYSISAPATGVALGSMPIIREGIIRQPDPLQFTDQELEELGIKTAPIEFTADELAELRGEK